MEERSPFAALRAALDARGGSEPEILGVRADPDRARRCGIPEIVYCRGKSADAIAAACLRLLEPSGRVVATRCDLQTFEEVRALLAQGGLATSYHPAAASLVATREGSAAPEQQGVIGLLTAGTSDWPAASVAKLVAEEAGCTVLAFQDVGVAGLHRLIEPLERLIAADVEAIIVAAGMDGVLPSVVTGLVDIPVIGLPTSTGYGHGGAGEGALTTMLQSCAPGIAVVNIDNGVGAAAMAVLIARRANRRRDG
jgi:NCAIR mutase (PurE)-related protein